MERFQYAVSTTPAEEGGFVVSCRDLPQVVTQGSDIAHALSEAADAMDEVFAAYMRGGLALPAPSKTRRGEHAVSPPAKTMAKAALYVAMKERKQASDTRSQGGCLASVDQHYVTAIRHG